MNPGDIFSYTCGRSNPDTVESDDVARSGPVSTVVSTAWLQNNLAATENVLVGLISNLVTCVQLNVVMSTVHLYYVKQPFHILRVLLESDGRIARHKHLNEREDRQAAVYDGTILSAGRWSLVQKTHSGLLLSFICVFCLCCGTDCKQ